MISRNGIVAVMKFGEVDIYQLKDVPEGSKKVTRLTKWLPAVQAELKFLTDECVRIRKDPKRFAMVVYHNGQVALYVDDQTDGAFDALPDDDK